MHATSSVALQIDLLMFYDDVEAYREDVKPQSRAAGGVVITVSSATVPTPRVVSAGCIISRYFTNNAEFAVPLPADVRAEVLQRHQESGGTPPEDLFTAAQQHVYTILEEEVFPRFSMTALEMSDDDPEQDLLINQAARYVGTAAPEFPCCWPTHASPRRRCYARCCTGASTGSRSCLRSRVFTGPLTAPPLPLLALPLSLGSRPCRRTRRSWRWRRLVSFASVGPVCWWEFEVLL